ncbi:hypothetical protein STEG23_031172 [Scotinomys teguina]
MILMHLLIESLFSLLGLLELCLVFDCGSLYLLSSVTGEKLCDNRWGIPDLIQPSQFSSDKSISQCESDKLSFEVDAINTGTNMQRTRAYGMLSPK